MPKYFKIFGPPGTGKTTKLLTLLEQELKRGVKLDRIAYLTFTVAARREAMERAKAAHANADFPYFKTLHAIAYQQLGITTASLLRRGDQLQDLTNMFGLKFNARSLDDTVATALWGGSEVGDRLMQFDHVRRHNLQDPREAFARHYTGDHEIEFVKMFCDTYRNWKDQEGYLDFTDMLEQASKPLDVDVVFVDEAQDLSKLQWKTLHAFASTARRVYVAGDDDQAIFKWAGASPESFIELEAQRTRVLDQSWRLPRAVHAVADRVSSAITYRQAKTFKPRDEEGHVRWIGAFDRNSVPDEGTCLVLYRQHYLSERVREQLQAAGIPYAQRGFKAPLETWREAIIGWERLRKGKEIRSKLLLATAEALPAKHEGRLRKVAKEAFSDDRRLVTQEVCPELPWGEPWFDALERIPVDVRMYLRKVIQHYGAAGITDTPRVQLSTIHAVKGAQADHVLLFTEMSRRVLEGYEQDPDDERRVWYVGVTRARQSLTLVGLDNPVLTPGIASGL